MTTIPAKPESRCTCRHDASHVEQISDIDAAYCEDRACHEIIRCAHCLNQDAEIQRLTQELAVEKERADSNYASCERVKGKFGNATEALKATTKAFPVIRRAI